MKTRNFYFLIGFFLTSCWNPVNEHTTEIGTLNYHCPEGAYEKILKQYSVSNISDSLFLSKLTEIERLPFTADVLYFETGPKELIALGEGWYDVRWVFNPDISPVAQNGFGYSIKDSDKERIMNRIYGVFEECGCSENK